MKKWLLLFILAFNLTACDSVQEKMKTESNRIQEKIKTEKNEIIKILEFFGIVSAYPPRTWKEEVRLSDGTIILTERSAHWKKTTKQSIKVIDAKGLDIPPEWSDKWTLVVLDRDKQGVWNLIVQAYGQTVCYDWNSKFPYRQYQAINGKWQQVAFDKQLHGRPANLEGDIYSQLSNLPDYLAVDKKKYTPTRDTFIVTNDRYVPLGWINIYGYMGCNEYCGLSETDNVGVWCDEKKFCAIESNQAKPQCTRLKQSFKSSNNVTK